jgi:hypothetical protein
VLAGWAANPAILRAFEEGARLYAPGVRVGIVDGTNEELRRGVWQAADLFTSLSDNLQETFGLAVIEAMASGLPVVASDWNGYRDLVGDGETGYLIPTAMVQDATRDTTARLLMGALNYDHFLAETSQAVIVDIAAAAAAYARLINDAALRRQMGEAARNRALRHFTWPVVIAAYEELWRQQDAERRAWLARQISPRPRYAGPAGYPAPEHSFAGYPTRWLAGTDHLQAVAGADAHLDRLLTTPLTNHVAERRSSDPRVLRQVLEAAATACPLDHLDAILGQNGLGATARRATLAWMLKYDLLRIAAAPGTGGA